MPLSTREKSLAAVAAIGLFGFFAQGQRPQTPTAHIDVGTPLPVHVTNAYAIAGAPSLPDGFLPGTRWRFTTYTSPSVLTWTAIVDRVSGPWARLQVRTEDNQTYSRWYYIPAMPGSWEAQ